VDIPLALVATVVGSLRLRMQLFIGYNYLSRKWPSKREDAAIRLSVSVILSIFPFGLERSIFLTLCSGFCTIYLLTLFFTVIVFV
jgi:hypothetical protein